jgi:hypothetical protein
MKNFKKIKNNLKAVSKKQELQNFPYFYISHANQSNDLQGIKSSLPKNQYLANDFANIIHKNDIKFPLETHIYNSKQELIQTIIGQNKKILGFIKIDSHLFLKKEIIKTYNFEPATIYSKINAAYLNVVKLTALLKHFSSKTEANMA